MSNTKIIIIDSICEWLGTTPSEMLKAPIEILSTSKIKDKVRLLPEQKAWAMICYILTSDMMRDLRMDEEQVAKYFEGKVIQVRVGKNQHEFLTTTSISYKMILGKILELTNEKLKPIYEPIEQ